MKIESIAAICHEANRRYCLTLGDETQPSWEDAPQWQRDSAMNGVRFHQDYPNAGPSGSHANWLKEKLADGWKYGPVKNPEIKEHPCCVPYGELPLEQRMKDYIFTAIVHACVQGRTESLHSDALPKSADETVHDAPVHREPTIADQAESGNGPAATEMTKDEAGALSS